MENWIASLTNDEGNISVDRSELIAGRLVTELLCRGIDRMIEKAGKNDTFMFHIDDSIETMQRRISMLVEEMETDCDVNNMEPDSIDDSIDDLAEKMASLFITVKHSEA